jgi:hypothetical protein
MATAAGRAQTTTSSSLAVSMTVQSSISLVFVNVAGAGSQGTCSLNGANTNAASVNFGIASLSGDNQSCVSFAANGSTSYTLSNNIYTLVTQSNITSSNYTMTASLSSAPPTGVSWVINSATLGTAATTLTSGGTYGSNLDLFLVVTVQHTVASGNLSQTINLQATAN